MCPNRTRIAALVAAQLLCVSYSFSFAQERKAGVTLIENVRLFDGKSPSLSGPTHVLIRGNVIERISTSPIPVDRSAAARIVAGNGRTLMPGMIDSHTHLTMSTVALPVLMTADFNYVMLRAGSAAESMLMSGFTSARDLGGPTFGLKRAIDEGFVRGPRIWPSGATISQTSGHGDFRTVHDLPRASGDAHFTEKIGATAIADGVDEVLRRTREQLMRGASQIKIMAGGGVSSDYDPLDVTQYTEAEVRAAVDAAANWGTYVTVHAYSPQAIQQSVRAGVKCIDHGQLADEATAKLMAAKGIWWSLQPFLDNPDSTPFAEGSPNRLKQIEMTNGTDTAYALAKKYKIKTAWGTDTLFDARLTKPPGGQLTKMVKWYSPAEVLQMATAGNAELLALSGKRNPYPGKLGVVEEGALADLLLLDGDPIANIKLLEDPEKNLVLIMKDGIIYKDITAK